MLSALLAIVQSWIPTLVQALAAVAVKGTLVLALAALAALALRKSSSATRHAVWCAALTGMLLLPVLALAVPEWTLPILPAPKPDAPVLPARPVIVSMPQSPAVPAPAAHRHAPAARSVSAPKAVLAPAVVPAPAVLQVPRAPATTAAPVLAARAVAEPTPRRPFT
ncbi:MAG TPA: hypothetical protein VGR66_09400, partial [Candidatus Eisenbacteria bacterium]|nr:hypothetical protein [Candidatus Eisenbacteria bacterium]